MEELKAMFRVCAHIKKDGVRCNSPAMKGMNFCYQHIGGNIRELTRAHSTYVGPKLDLLYPGDRQSIQHNLHVVAQAMNDGNIDLQTANTYNRIYSACERNLRRFETLYQKDAEAELAPLPDEAPDSEPASQPNDTAGAPSFRAAGAPVNRSSFTGWSVSSHERVGEQDRGPLKQDGGLSGVQTDSQPSPSNVIPAEPTAPIAVQANTFDTQMIDYKKYDDRFDEIERLYSSHPDYGDRVRAAIRQIQEEEKQAWLAAGCPSFRQLKPNAGAPHLDFEM